MNLIKARKLEKISDEKKESFIGITDKTGSLTKRRLILLNSKYQELKNEIDLYWKENIGWLDDEIYNKLYLNLDYIKAYCYFYDLDYYNFVCKQCETILPSNYIGNKEYCLECYK